MTDTPKIIMPPEKHVLKPNVESAKVVPINPPISPEDAERKARQEEAARLYDLGNQVLLHVVKNTTSPIEAMGVLSMVHTRLAMGLNSDLWGSGQTPMPQPPSKGA